MKSKPSGPVSTPFSSAVADAGIAAFIALLLTSLVLGLRTTDTPAGLVLVPRTGLVVLAVSIVFFGRLLLNMLRGKKIPSNLRINTLAEYHSRFFVWARKYSGRIFLTAAFLLPLILLLAERQTGARMPLRYWFDIATLVLTYIMLGWGLNIVVGLAGLLDLGYVAFYAVGAYSYGLLAQHFGFSFWICLPLAGLLAAFWGIILGFPVLRLRGDYLAIVTLAFGEMIRIVLLNWYQFTGGPDGLSGIPRPDFFGLTFKRFGDHTFHGFLGIEYSSLYRILFLYYIILMLALLTNAVSRRLRRLPVGRAWEAMREDEIACRSLGINTVNTKLTAFATGAMFGGFAGSFFATRQGFISPESFTFIESAIILAIVVLGGMGSQAGIVIASIVMIGGFELLRNMQGLKLVFGDGFDPSLYRMLLFGMAMVAIMVWRPGGLVSARRPTIFLTSGKTERDKRARKGEKQ